MKLDNQTIMMVVVAIVLGMLVANMFKEVCGCNNLIEGQTLQNGCIIPPVTAPSVVTYNGHPISESWSLIRDGGRITGHSCRGITTTHEGWHGQVEACTAKCITQDPPHLDCRSCCAIATTSDER